MHFYGISYRELKSTPIKAFWLMNSSINRIQAEKDVRSMKIQVAVAAIQSDSNRVSELGNELVAEMGQVVVMDPVSALSAERDEKGIQELKAMVF